MSVYIPVCTVIHSFIYLASSERDLIAAHREILWISTEQRLQRHALDVLGAHQPHLECAAQLADGGVSMEVL